METDEAIPSFTPLREPLCHARDPSYHTRPCTAASAGCRGAIGSAASVGAA